MKTSPFKETRGRSQAPSGFRQAGQKRQLALELLRRQIVNIFIQQLAGSMRFCRVRPASSIAGKGEIRIAARIRWPKFQALLLRLVENMGMRIAAERFLAE
ncbi:MAG: hypothetical protein WKF84_19430 [Pyrinomonadaceae bacterium]